MRSGKPVEFTASKTSAACVPVFSFFSYSVCNLKFHRTATGGKKIFFINYTKPGVRAEVKNSEKNIIVLKHKS